MGFSLFFKLADGRRHLSIVENSLFKATGSTWKDWYGDMKDRRDMSEYLRRRWLIN